MTKPVGGQERCVVFSTTLDLPGEHVKNKGGRVLYQGEQHNEYICNGVPQMSHRPVVYTYVYPYAILVVHSRTLGLKICSSSNSGP